MRRLLRWRRVGTWGGLALAACFFLPAVKGCSEPVYPVLDLYEFVVEGTHGTETYGILGWMWGVGLYAAPYALGLLCAVLLLRSRTRQQVRPEDLRRCCCASCSRSRSRRRSR
jgi:hypothetical protein